MCYLNICSLLQSDFICLCIYLKLYVWGIWWCGCICSWVHSRRVGISSYPGWWRHRETLLECMRPSLLAISPYFCTVPIQSPPWVPKFCSFQGYDGVNEAQSELMSLSSASSLAREEFSKLLTLSNPVQIKGAWCLQSSKGSFVALVGTVDHLFPSPRSGCAPVCALHSVLQGLLQTSSCARYTVGVLLGDCPVWSHSPVLGLADVYKSCPKNNNHILYIYTAWKSESEVNPNKIGLMTSQRVVVGISSSFFHEVLKFWELLICELSRTRSAFVKLR